MISRNQYQSRYCALLGLFILLLLCSTCNDSVVDEYKPQLSVFTIFSNTQVVQEIIVDRTYGIDEPAGPLIDDAIVVLSTSGRVDTLEFSYSSERYLTTPFNLMPGDTYDLMVAKDGFDTLLATTTVPDTFTIFFPIFGDTLMLEDTISLTRSAGAALYSLSFIHETGGFGPFFWHEPNPLDTIVQVPVSRYLNEPFEGYFTIYIAAYDSNFYEYYQSEGDSIIQAGVTGGVGLFGSAWTRATLTYVLFQ
jgi:hypothetical protein